MQKLYAVFSIGEDYDPTPYSSICDVEVELYGICREEEIKAMVKEVREHGCHSQVVRLPLGSLLDEDDPMPRTYIQATLLCKTYGHWE